MVAGETKLFMRASSAIFQVVADGIGILGSDLKKTLPVVTAENDIFRTALMKKCKKIILPKLDRISNLTSDQIGRKLKITLLTNLDRSVIHPFFHFFIFGFLLKAASRV